MPRCSTPFKCRISMSPSETTDMYFEPVYDGHGKNLNPDGNISSGSAKCGTCGKKWTYGRQFGETTFTELGNQEFLSE